MDLGFNQLDDDQLLDLLQGTLAELQKRDRLLQEFAQRAITTAGEELQMRRAAALVEYDKCKKERLERICAQEATLVRTTLGVILASEGEDAYTAALLSPEEVDEAKHEVKTYVEHCLAAQRLEELRCIQVKGLFADTSIDLSIRLGMAFKSSEGAIIRMIGSTQLRIDGPGRPVPLFLAFNSGVIQSFNPGGAPFFSLAVITDLLVEYMRLPSNKRFSHIPPCDRSEQQLGNKIWTII